ncbi:MAG: hypothetical protein DRQ89_02935 [Epsilonproteobacteria bacterium]|nr:MAG: hypothetical protein DRQ89_02935 [Campylobacterota bacterium]
MSKQILLIIFLLPLNLFANYTGNQILKASQRHGMTDNELKYLLNNTDPDLTVKDNKFGATALIHASINNRPNMVLLLLAEGGAEIDETDYNRETALMGASRNCHQKVIDILLEFGADKALVGKFNKTAYDYAKQKCGANIIKKIGGPSGKEISSMSSVVKAKSLFRKKSGDADLSPRGYKALQDLVKVKGILDYMDKTQRASTMSPEKQKKSFENMAKAVGAWPALYKEQKARAAKEAKRKQGMKKDLQASKKRAMRKLKAMGQLKQSGSDYRTRKDNLLNEKVNAFIVVKEKEREEEKEKEINEGNRRKELAIVELIFSGSKNKDLNSLKNENEDILIGKRDAIKELLDAEEGKIEANTKLKMARKKHQALRHFKSGGKQFRDKMRALELEGKRAEERAELEVKQAEERRKKEYESKLALEKKRILRELNKKEKRLQDERRLAEEKNKRRNSIVFGGTHEKSNIVKIDEKNKTITTSDFQINFLKHSNCEIKKRGNGTYFLFILTYKAKNIKQAGRNRAIWFINKSTQPAPVNGGKKCSRSTCKDYAIFHAGGVRKDLFMNNLAIELGKGPKEYFEIYSSKVGNSTIKVNVKECKNFPKELLLK